MSEENTQAAAAETALPENARKVKFHFKTVDIKDDDGNIIAKDFKHPEVEGVLPVPTEDEIVVALRSRNADGTRTKQSQMLMEGVYALIENAARGQIVAWREENPPKSTFAWSNFDMSKLTIEAISNLPKGQRGAWAPSDDDLKAFNESYADTMVNAVAYDPNRVKIHCAHYLKGLSKMKTDKAALGKMLELLTVFASNASEEVMEEQADTYNWLRERATKYMNYTPKNFADGL
jgi:hypothetical protein